MVGQAGAGGKLDPPVEKGKGARDAIDPPLLVYREEAMQIVAMTVECDLVEEQ